MEPNTGAPLREMWYFALHGPRLRQGQILAKTMLGEPVLLGRDDSGAVFALRDICPHRGIPLSYGRLDKGEVECCYHGWRFAPDGRCMAIPSLVDGQALDLAKIRVKTYPAREVQGNIWVYFGEDPSGAPDIPVIPGLEIPLPKLFDSMRFPCPIDHAVVGLMDPAHGPFVHRAWWWRSRRSIHEKAKSFGPAAYGFAMKRHAPSSNSNAYRLLGGKPETEIAFHLPSVRIEHISVGKHVLCNLTAVTPVSRQESEINHAIYWTMPWLTVLRPALRPFVRAFLRQDRDIMTMQQDGLKYEPNLMLINDADTQAKWYYRLKNEYIRARAENRPFQNPVTERVLRWRS